MIVLKDLHYIGEGLIRKCYAHPKNKNQCVKVPKPHVTRDYTYKEILYYLKIQKRNRSKFSYSFYSVFFASTQTVL